MNIMIVISIGDFMQYCQHICRLWQGFLKPQCRYGRVMLRSVCHYVTSLSLSSLSSLLSLLSLLSSLSLRFYNIGIDGTTNPSLIQDLDLIAVSPTKAYYYSNNGNGLDSVNNNEKVIIDGPNVGIWSIIVKAKVLPYGSQLFSIVITSSGSVIGIKDEDLSIYDDIYTDDFKSDDDGSAGGGDNLDDIYTDDFKSDDDDSGGDVDNLDDIYNDDFKSDDDSGSAGDVDNLDDIYTDDFKSDDDNKTHLRAHQ